MPDLPVNLELDGFTLCNRHGTAFGKPNFPPRLESYNIKDYIGPDSPGLFHILRLDASFLLQPVEKWCTSDSYRSCLKVVKSLHPVNDAAERGVKLASHFLTASHDEGRFQNVLQVVEKARSLVPNQRVRRVRK